MHGNAQTAAQKNRAQLKATVEIETNKTSLKISLPKTEPKYFTCKHSSNWESTEYCQKLRTTIIRRTPEAHGITRDTNAQIFISTLPPGKEHIGSEPSYHSIQVKPVKPNTSSPSSPSNLSSRRRPEGLTNLTDLMELMLLMARRPRPAASGICGPPELIWPFVGQPRN